VHLPAVATLLAAWALLALAGGVGLLVGLALPGTRPGVASFAARETGPLLRMAFAVALVATLGSLYFSEVVGFVPCLLCWYQRIAMYPLAVVLGVAALRVDAGIWRYALPLAGVGALISGYHVLIQLRPTLDVVTCTADAPCTVRYLAVFGFVSIPVMAGCGFLAIGATLLALRQGEQAQAANPAASQAGGRDTG
jgi:hypothetical protein